MSFFRTIFIKERYGMEENEIPTFFPKEFFSSLYIRYLPKFGVIVFPLVFVAFKDIFIKLRALVKRLWNTIDSFTQRICN